MRRPNHASRFEGIAKTNLQASRASDTETLQSQVNKAAKKRLSLSGLEIRHGRLWTGNGSLDELVIGVGRFRFQLGVFLELLREQPKLMAAPGTAAPDETNLSCRFMAEQRSGNEVCALKQAGIDCQFGQQGGAETVVDHLHQCWKARRFEALGETPVRKTADRKRVVTQAVTVLQQQQVLAPQALGLNARLLGEQVLAR